MKKALYILICCLAINLLHGQIIGEAHALFTKVDVTKTPSKLSNWAQTQKAKCEKILESVQTSQFGQFVGDGIKYTKEGIKYAQDVYNKSMDLYGEVKENVLNSAEYKTALISKEIAQESKKLKELQEEKLKKQEEIQSEMELLKEQTAAQITAIQQNIEILEQSQEQAVEGDAVLTRAETNSSSSQEDLEVTSEMSGIEEEINQIQSAMEMQLSDYEREIEDIEEEYQEKIINQGEKIAELTKELSEVASSSGIFKKKEPRDSKETLLETMEKFLFSGIPSIKEENKIKEQRKENLSEVIIETTTQKADKQLSRATTEEKTNTKEDLSETMTGESEGSGISAEVLSEQLQVLRSYIEVILADLKLQTSIEVNSLRRISSVPLKSKFNLCDYTDPSNVGLEGIKKKADVEMSTVKQFQESAASVKENIQKAQAAASEVQNTVSDVSNQYQQVNEMAKNAQGISKNYDIELDTSTIGVF